MTYKQQHIYHYFIDAWGDWFCEGNPVDDQQLFSILSRGIVEEDGKYVIRCEGEVHPVEVEDAPLWVRYIHVKKDDGGNVVSVEVELRDGRREPLAAETLTLERGNALYCLATPRRLKTRFGKAAYYEFADLLGMEEESGVFYITIAGRRYDIRTAIEPEPGPESA